MRPVMAVALALCGAAVAWHGIAVGAWVQAVIYGIAIPAIALVQIARLRRADLRNESADVFLVLLTLTLANLAAESLEYVEDRLTTRDEAEAVGHR